MLGMFCAIVSLSVFMWLGGRQCVDTELARVISKTIRGSLLRINIEHYHAMYLIHLFKAIIIISFVCLSGNLISTVKILDCFTVISGNGSKYGCPFTVKFKV
jgi:hypothetical protein